MVSNLRLWHLFLLLQLFSVVAIGAAKAPVDTIGFEAVDLYPHGFAWDARNNRFLVGSSGSGVIISVSGDDGEVEEFVTDDGYAAKAGVMGVVVDPKLNRVVVAVQDVEAWGFSGVAAYDLDTKERIYFTRLDQLGVGEGDKSCAHDVAVDHMGNAYVTNCRSNFIWKVTKDGIPSVFLQHANFTSQPTLVDSSMSWCGLTGIVYHKQGYLLASHASSGELFRITLDKEDDKNLRVVLMKEKLPGANSIGLREYGTLVVVAREKIWLVGSASNWMAANAVDTVPLNSSDHVTAVVSTKSTTFILPSYISEKLQGLSRQNFEVRKLVFPAEIHSDDPVWLIVTIVVIVVVVSLWRFQMVYLYKQYRKKRT